MRWTSTKRCPPAWHSTSTALTQREIVKNRGQSREEIPLPLGSWCTSHKYVYIYMCNILQNTQLVRVAKNLNSFFAQSRGKSPARASLTNVLLRPRILQPKGTTLKSLKTEGSNVTSTLRRSLHQVQVWASTSRLTGGFMARARRRSAKRTSHVRLQQRHQGMRATDARHLEWKFHRWMQRLAPPKVQ